jgi:uncharacterized membrane protein
MERDHERPRLPRELEFDVDRIATFNDAVMAIAITLLVLDLSPEIADGATNQQVWEALKDLVPNFLAFAFSFWLISRFWTSNLLYFQAVKKIDMTTLQFNVFFLFIVALLPFPTALLATTHVTEASVIVYSTALVLASVAQAGLWFRLEKEEHRTDDTAAFAVRFRTLQYLISAIVFIISIPLAMLNVYLAMGFWVLFGFTRLFAEYSSDNIHWVDKRFGRERDSR